ncbi:helix-turn-helix domain-containing protein [Clostridium paraputrificum]|uniref:helix-turn-helix domain-containing protein n=1 Tax=Clostridium paraputrificum TaxID=29363 RepID=UPI000C0864B1|nr:helix-turn-helix transcriptional regulator [Clostridium paraputrificum]
MGVNEFIKIGDKIKEIRKLRGLTQRDVAKKLNIPYSTYSNYENNNREPNKEILIKIAEILNVDIFELMGLSEDIDSIQSDLKYVLETMQKLDKSKKGDFTELNNETIKQYFSSVIIDILLTSSESKSLNYNFDDFKENEINELCSFVFSSYQLKVNEILERHKKERTKEK